MLRGNLSTQIYPKKCNKNYKLQPRKREEMRALIEVAVQEMNRDGAGDGQND